uniref:Uncharacterized protein n=1 Tax=Knipowitschia caucasica TaxID=637954 RepID=A0AAV2LPK0_KNICA
MGLRGASMEAAQTGLGSGRPSELSCVEWGHFEVLKTILLSSPRDACYGNNNGYTTTRLCARTSPTSDQGRCKSPCCVCGGVNATQTNRHRAMRIMWRNTPH